MKIKHFKIIGIVFSLVLILGLSLNSTLTNFFALNGQSNEDLKVFNSFDLHLSSSITWTTNGIIICNETYYQEMPQIISDGYGGAIIAWEDRRTASYINIYAQRIDSDGNALWDPNGTVICSASWGQVRVQLCSDGLGGAIITWDDSRGPTYDIYAQRIDSAGNVKWTLDGEEICTEVEDQKYVQICSDGVGGAIITWEDYRVLPGRQIWAQRIDQNGNVLWDANGTLIRAPGGHPQIINNGMGAAIITCAQRDVWAQKIALNGTVLWGADGIDICDEDGTQTIPHLCSDGSGGAIITWGDARTGTFIWDVYAQRVASNGTVLWTLNGSAICTEIGSQGNARICSDDSGGAIITWTDTRAGGYDIYAQKIDSAGNVKWTLNGSAICTAYESQIEIQLCHDGYGGSIIVWRDYRNGNDWDVYAQWVDTDGNVELMGGMLICNATDDQYNPQICSDGSGGAFITWEDHRFSHSDVYAQHFITPEREIEDGNGEPSVISFGLFYLFFIIIAMISLVSISKRRSFFKSK